MAWSTGILNGTLYVTDYRLNSESLSESRSPEARIASSCFPYDAFIDVTRSTVAYVILGHSVMSQLGNIELCCSCCPGYPSMLLAEILHVNALSWRLCSAKISTPFIRQSSFEASAISGHHQLALALTTQNRCSRKCLRVLCKMFAVYFEDAVIWS